MRKTIKILFFLFSVFSFSCEEQPFFVKCDECTTEEPLKAQLKMKLDKSAYGVSTVINVYSGNLEDGVLYGTISTTSDETSMTVTLNKKYTVTATYNIDGITYIAVDSATPRVTYNKDQCNDPCYYIYDNDVNLRLKYTK
jgi:hypothetical protein